MKTFPAPSHRHQRFDLCIAFMAAFLSLSALVAQEVPEQKTVITSDGPCVMTSDGKKTTIHWENNVSVVGTNLKMTCDFLEVVVLRSGDPAATIGDVDRFESLLATGNVVITQGERVAKCGRAEILPNQDKIELTGNPSVTVSDSRIEGERITMWRGRKTVEVTHSTTTLPPLKDLGFDEEKAKKQQDQETPKQP